MQRLRLCLSLLTVILYSLQAEGILFGGSSGCCCSCGIPMPPICGCQPTCPPPLPCPPPICPICQTCPAPQPCPPPPVAVCPAPQPVYVQPPCGCGGGIGGGGIRGIAGGGAGFGGGIGGASYGGGMIERGPPPLPSLPIQGGSYIGGQPQASVGVEPGQVPFARPFPQQEPHVMMAPAEAGYQRGESMFPQNNYSEQPQAVQATQEMESEESYKEEKAKESSRRASGVVTVSENKCNSPILQELLTKHINEEDPVASKRAIHKAAEEIKDTVIDIICSDAGFTYIVSTSEYCEAQKGKVICFIYKKP